LCRDGDGKRWVVDLTDQSIYPADTSKQTETPFDKGEALGVIWSPFDYLALSSPDEADQLFKSAAALLEKLAIPLRELAQHPSLAERKVLPLERIAQEESNYCAAATAQMLLRFYIPGFPKTQDEIAKDMRIKPTDLSAKVENQVSAIKKLTADQFEAELDKDPTFQEVCDHINDGQPFKNSIPGHARATVGWSLSRAGNAGEYVLIHDPQVPGSAYFEKWNLTNIIKNHMYVSKV
jgi:hypothetical protein